MEKSTSSQASGISIFPLLMVNFIGTLGYSIIIPFLVFLVNRFGGNSVLYGILGSTYPLFQLIGAPLLGRWSDMYGRKKILLLSQAGTFISWCILITALLIPITELFEIHSPELGDFVFTWPLVILFLARAFDGLTGGNVSVANAYLADISDDQNRKANFGKLGMSANLGFILGPVLAGVLGATVYKELIPVSVALLISLAAIFVIAFFLPESKCKPLTESPDRDSMRKVLGQEHKDCYSFGENDDDEGEEITLAHLLQFPNIPFILALYFLIFLGFNIFYTAFPVHAAGKLGWDVTQLGIYFSVLSGLLILVQGPILSLLSPHFSDEALTIVGSLILAGSFVCLSSDVMWIIYSSAIFFALGNGLMWPSYLSILSKTAKPRYQGYLQGVATSLGSLASIIGLIGGGILYGYLEKQTFLLATAVMLVVFLLCLRLPLMHQAKA